MMRTSRSTLLLGVIVALLSTLPLGSPAFGDGNRSRCSVGALDGLYIFRASGFIVTPSPNPAQPNVVPKAINELIRFNGDGTADVPGGTISVSGVINPTVGSGTYDVTELMSEEGACAGSLTFASGPSFNLVIPLRGNIVWMIQNNPNNVFEGTATKIAR